MQSFNPLEATPPENQNLVFANQQSQVRSVLDSYHGKLDGVIEAVQNGVDAIEKRWKSWTPSEDIDETTPDSVPRIRIELNFDENSIGILDNGCGVKPDELPSLLSPFFSDKRVDPDSTRGHKGVGTTLLAYGSKKFEIHTKTQDMEDAVGYVIEGGRDWVFGEPKPSPPFNVLPATNSSLAQQDSGTFVKIFFDANVSSQRMSSVLHNTPKMWATVLRGSSALGYIKIASTNNELPFWVRKMDARIHHTEGVEKVNFSFPLPHTFSITNAVKCKNLQWLQNNPSNARQFSLIFCERNHDQLKQLLQTNLSTLENSEEDEDKLILAAFKKYEVEIYASLAYKNTFYDEQFRKGIKKPNAKRLSIPFSVGGGVLLSSVNMPMADLQAHTSPTIQPQLRRRYLLVLHLNDNFSPDIGRKTIPQELRSLAGWLEKTLLKLLRTQERRLLKDKSKDESPRGSSLDKAQEELKAFEEEVKTAESNDDGVNFSDLILSRTPMYEEEVVALFLNLLVENVLIGYHLRALPGNATRYDCLFDYSLTLSEATQNDKWGLHEDQVGSGIKFSSRWLEFKKDVDGLVRNLEAEDGDPSKKYFSQINVAVVWEANSPSSDHYDLVSLDIHSRQFFGATHVLRSGNNDHQIEIIELRSVIENWQLGKQ